MLSFHLISSIAIGESQIGRKSMKRKMKSIPFLILVLLVVFPLKTALALVVNTPIVVDRGEKHRVESASFAVLTIEQPKLGEYLNFELIASHNNLPIAKNETSIGLQTILNSAFLNVSGLTDEFTPTSIPTSVLLLGSGLIGLIGIARRSLFTR